MITDLFGLRDFADFFVYVRAESPDTQHFKYTHNYAGDSALFMSAQSLPLHNVLSILIIMRETLRFLCPRRVSRYTTFQVYS